MEYYIRPIESKDARGMNALRRMPGVFENILGIPSERITRNEDGIRNLGSNTHSFVAVTALDGGEELVIGCCALSTSMNPRRRHSADVGMMVHADYQGIGVGKKLMETMLDIADNWLMLVRVELDVYTDNERAIALYKKFGFEIEGTKVKEAIRNGEYVDSYMMARIKEFK